MTPRKKSGKKKTGKKKAKELPPYEGAEGGPRPSFAKPMIDEPDVPGETRERVLGVERKGPGRPPGSRNPKVKEIAVVPPGCPRCGSTKRSAYWGKRERRIDGQVDGKKYRKVVWRRCRCEECGQVRIERAYL